MILGVRNRGYVIFGESASGGKRMAFSGKTRNKKDVCEMCVSVCVHTHFKNRCTSKCVKERDKDTYSKEGKVKDHSKRG